MDSFKKYPVAVLSAFTIWFLVIAFWASRAPTAFTGTPPLFAAFLPFEWNVVYLIVYGPIIVMLCSLVIWLLIADGNRDAHNFPILQDRHTVAKLMATSFVLISALCSVLSLQYFVILAPKEMCASRPHFEFLWTYISGTTRIAHCMSGTDAINAKAPYYIEPQIFQSWGHVLWPLLTMYFLARAWRAWNAALRKV